MDLNQAKNDITEKDKTIKEYESQQKSAKPVKTQKAKMEFFLTKLKTNNIPVFKSEWEEFSKTAKPKYAKESTKYPSFQFTKEEKRVVPQTEQTLPPPATTTDAQLHVINWQMKNHSVIEVSDPDTDDDYISDGDTSYSSQVQINTYQPKTQVSGQPKALFSDGRTTTTNTSRTPGLKLDDAMLFASTPSTTIQLTPTQLDQFEQTLQNIKPRVNLKLSDISAQGKDRNLAEWGRSLYGIIQKSNWTADDFQLVMETKVNNTYRYQMDDWKNIPL